MTLECFSDNMASVIASAISGPGLGSEGLNTLLKALSISYLKSGFVDLKNTPKSYRSGFWILLKMPVDCFLTSVAKSQYYFAMLHIP